MHIDSIIITAFYPVSWFFVIKVVKCKVNCQENKVPYNEVINNIKMYVNNTYNAKTLRKRMNRSGTRCPKCNTSDTW